MKLNISTILFSILVLLMCLPVVSYADVSDENSKNTKVTKKQPNKKIAKKDPDEAIDNSPGSYSWKSEKEKIFEKKPKEVYGKKTTKYITYNNLKFYSKPKYLNIEEPSLLNFHHYTLNEKHKFMLQMLTVDGSSARHIFWQAPEHIGVLSGHSNFNLYAMKLKDLRLFDTKSPYTFIYIVPMKKHATINIDFSQNINSNWNVGASFHYLSMASPLEMYPTRKFAMSRNWNLFTHYKTKNGKYQIVASYISMKHYMKELYYNFIFDPKSNPFVFKDEKIEGGFTVFKNINMDFPFNGKPKLYPNDYGGVGKNLQIKSLCNIYQQYEIFKNTHLFYELGWLHSRNSLGEKDGSDTADDDPKNVQPERSTTLHNISNEIGFKATVFEKLFYMVYCRRQDIFRRYDHLLLERQDIIENKLKNIKLSSNEADRKNLISKHVSEHYIGGLVRYNINDSNVVQTDCEFLFNKFYKIKTQYFNDIFDVAIMHSKRKLPFIYDSYMIYSGSPGYNYDQERVLFESQKNNKYINSLNYCYPITLKLLMGAKFSVPYVNFRPNINYTSIGKKYLDLGIYICPGLDINFKFGSFYIDNKLIFSFKLRDASNANYGLPLIFLYSRFYYMSAFFKNKLKIATGFDLIYKTSYPGTNYSIGSGYREFVEGSVNQSEQYYIAGQPVINLFLNIRYDHFTLFGKITHVNQGLPKSGELTSPGFAGQGRSYDLGVSWYFFD